MNNPVRIILKKVDFLGTETEAKFKTVDIDSEVLERIMCKDLAHSGASYKVVGAEALNEKEAVKRIANEKAEQLYLECIDTVDLITIPLGIKNKLVNAGYDNLYKLWKMKEISSTKIPGILPEEINELAAALLDIFEEKGI